MLKISPKKSFKLGWITVSTLICLGLQAVSGEAQLVELFRLQDVNELPPGLKIIDARPVAAWQKGHLPGALSLDWQDFVETDGGAAGAGLDAGKLSRRLGLLGVAETSPVLIYGDANSSWGGEGWVCWALCRLGHQGPIYLLEGGVQAWQQQGGLMHSKSAPRLGPTRYRVNERASLEISTAGLKQQANLQLIDTRSFFEWLRGGLPDAVRIPWTAFFRGEQRRPLTPEELVRLLREHDIDPQQPVVYYCSVGIRSAYAWTVHTLAGLPLARNYAGGMNAWQKQY